MELRANFLTVGGKRERERTYFIEVGTEKRTPHPQGRKASGLFI